MHTNKEFQHKKNYALAMFATVAITMATCVVAILYHDNVKLREKINMAKGRESALVWEIQNLNEHIQELYTNGVEADPE